MSVNVNFTSRQPLHYGIPGQKVPPAFKMMHPSRQAYVEETEVFLPPVYNSSLS